MKNDHVGKSFYRICMETRYYRFTGPVDTGRTKLRLIYNVINRLASDAVSYYGQLQSMTVDPFDVLHR